MKTRGLVRAAATALMFWAAAAAGAGKNITVFMGEVRVMEVGSVDRVAVGNGKLLSTTVLDNGQLLLLAEEAGDTVMHLWYTNGTEDDFRVTIVAKDSGRLQTELATLLQDVGDIEVKEVGERLYLTGSVLTSDEELLSTVLTNYPGVIDLTRKTDPDVLFPKEQNKMVYMDVKITEFNTDKLRDLGIDWSDAVAGPSAALAVDQPTNDIFRAAPDADLTPSFAQNLPLGVPGWLGFFGLASEITSKINLLASTGDAIILAEPKLSARSGGQAEFLAGGEIPVVTTGTLGSSNVEFKEFGIKLAITPIVDSFTNIMANVSTEVSAVDRSNAVGDVPAFITRKTTTDIRMRDGQTLVLSGLIDRDVGKSVQKIPFLGDLPVLGRLFSSESFNDNRTELVIFVSPTVFDAEADLNKQKVQRRQEIIDIFKKNTEYEDLILD
jgi:pilus assembly protein CpaC